MSQPDVNLLPEQAAALEEAESWVATELGRLGAAHLEHTDALQALVVARAKVAACEKTATSALRQRSQVQNVVAEELALGPGEWTFDRKKQKMVLLLEAPHD